MPTMASEAFEILRDCGGKNFTEISARPPVLGEENEVQSNGAGDVIYNCNNGPFKFKNNRCTTAALTKAEVGPSPAATPRKSNLEKRDVTSCALPLCADDEDVEAPLGFEPEGSAASSPPYLENITPPHLRWAENLKHLLSDSEGVALFKEFLELEHGGSEELQFWLACHGLKRKANSDSVDVHNIVKVIFKAYLRCDKVKSISKETKKEIVDKISHKSKVDQCVFDEAQSEVEAHFRDVSYPDFLNSDLYVQYVNNYAESPKSSRSSGSNSETHTLSQTGLLPVLHEDKELGAEDIASSSGVFVVPKTPDGRQPYVTSSRHTESMVGGSKSFTLGSRSSLYPTHVSYVPVSAQDSELQSLSSDAHTDDTMSLTDTSSADGKMTYSRRRYKKYALQNREYRTGLHTQIIPRTERAPKEPNLAETDPGRFAHLLIEKLKKVVESRDAEAKVEERLRILKLGEVSEEDTTINRSFAKHNTTATFIPIMPPGPQSSSALLGEESAESILDFHCSRVWSSSHHSPTQSPGRGSPFKSPDRSATQWARARQAQLSLSTASESSSSGVAGYPPRPHAHHGRKDPALSRSFDCGVVCGEDKVKGETHQHIHHHHHHHHSRGGHGSKHWVEVEQQVGNLSWRGDPSSGGFEHARNSGKAGAKKSGGRKSGAGTMESRAGAVGGVYEPDSSTIVPNFSNPSSEKVMKWINDTVRGNKASSSVDTDRSSSTKRAHRHSSTGASSQSHKQSTKNKTMAHTPARSASAAEQGGGGNVSLSWGVAGGPLPSQPFVQDSNMPLPTPPNPTTQLEEAKRRLEESHHHVATPAKSKSFSAVPSRDKVRIVPGSVMPPPSHIPPVRKVSADQDLSTSIAESTPSAAARQSRPTAGSSSASQSDCVVVGMYYEQEPIPFRFTLPGRTITLEQIKHLNTKKGNFKYFFKRDSDEFGEGAVFEEVKEDHMVVPTWKGKIVAQVQKVD